MPTVTDNRVKRALLIGIDQYPRITQLEGCVNDVELVRAILVDAFGFPASNVKLIANSQATREAILAELDALVDRTGRDDIVVIHYAGHGSQMTDREGDEPSGLDSTIMPFDSEGWTGDNRDITDDEIHLRLLKLGERTSFITLIFDSCHSGTITRDIFGASGRSIRADTRPQSELPPSPIPAPIRQAMRESGPSGWMPLADQYVLIAGCRDEETSFEYRPPEGDGKIVHGALTYFLSEELRRATPGTSYRDVFERVSAKVNSANPGQHPQMEGRADREIFGVTDLEPMRFAAIVARDGDSVTIGMGAALGMTVGSVFSAYPQATKRADGLELLGTIEITRVHATTSDARVTSEAVVGAIGAGARAVETIHAYGDLRLRVQVVAVGSAPEPGALRDALGASPLLSIVEDANSASACIYLLPARHDVAPGDPVPQLGPLPGATWAVVGDDGQLLMPPKDARSYGSVVENLERLARYRQALALDNPDPDSRLRGQVTLELLRKRDDVTWVVAEPEAAGGHIVFEDGDAIAFRVTNRGDQPLFVSLLDFGLTGSVSVVYPARGAAEQLRAGGFFEIGTKTDKPAFILRMPKDFPYATDASAGATGGIETLKLFVTTALASFDFLSQEKMRSAFPKSASPLTLLLQAAAIGSAKRDIGVSVPIGEEDWATVVKPLLLSRRSKKALDNSTGRLQIGDADLRAPGLRGSAPAE